MKSSSLALALVLCGCATNRAVTESGPRVAASTPRVYDAVFHPTNRGWGSPIFEDQFNGASLNPANWVAAIYCGGYNGEEQCYTNRPYNLWVANGELLVVAWNQVCSGTAIAAVDNPAANEVGFVNCAGGGSSGQPGGSAAQSGGRYSSGRIHTRVSPSPKSWTYGRVEIRAVLPEGKGAWPAFWMLPVAPPANQTWPQSGEIDIMEAVNLHTGGPGIFIPAGDKVQSNIHFCSDNPLYPIDTNASQSAKNLCKAWGTTFNKVHNEMSRSLGTTSGTLLDLTGNFHTYALEWTDVDMRFYVDDQLIGQIAHGLDSQNHAPFRQPFYLIINLAVGGAMPGPPDPDNWMLDKRTIMRIDWVRVYDCPGDPTAKNCVY